MRPASFKALHKRYMAGIEAVECGADPMLTLSYVVWPTLDVSQASRGKTPTGWRFLTDEEYREMKNERLRRYAQPMSARWRRAA